MRYFKIAGIFIRALFKFPGEVYRECREIQEMADYDVSRPGKRMKKPHDMKCIKKHLLERGRRYLNDEKASEFQKGVGDGLLRALDILNGDITGSCCHISLCDCICKRKRINKFDHWE